MEEYRKTWREIVWIVLAGTIIIIGVVGGDTIGRLLQAIR